MAKVSTTITNGVKQNDDDDNDTNSCLGKGYVFLMKFTDVY